MSVPTVIGIDPASGPAGTQVVITGTGFTEDTLAVLFGAVSVGTRFAVISSTQILAYVPEAAGTVHVRVTTPEGTSAEVAGDQFTVAPYVGPPGGGGGVAPTVTSVVPDTAVDNDGGDTIAVHGTGFTTTIAVRFGVAAESPQGVFEVVSDTELSVLTPPGSDTVDVIVTNSYGESAVSAADEFTYPDAAAPTVSAIAPNGGYYGNKVTITGTGFDLATSVYFGEEPAPFTATADETIIAYVPEGSGAVHVTVVGPGGSSAETAADLFTYGSGALPKTTATNVQGSGYTGWAQGAVTVTLIASANGGYGVAKTYYQLGGGGITEYSGPFVVSAAGSNIVRYWSVDVRGNVEPMNTGWVNILSASAVPTGLTLTPGIGFISAKWDNLVTARPTTYKLYIGSANPPTTLYAATGANVVTIKRASADGLTYVAVSSVDVAGNESAKCAAQSATAVGAAADLADHAISQAKLALDIRPPKIVAALPTLPATEYPAGSIVYLTSDACLYKTTTGAAGSWVRLVGSGELQDDCVVFGKIAVAAVGADELAANSVFANHLTVANFTNLIPNPTSEQDLSDMPAGGFEGVDVYTPVTPDTAYEGTTCRRLVGAGTGSYQLSTLTPLIPCVAGEQYFMSAMCRLSAASATGSARLWVQCLDAANAVVTQPTTTAITSTAWTLSEAAFTVPAGAVKMRLTLAANFLETDRYAYADNMMLRKMADGNLIVDGAITTDKLDALAVTAAKIAAGTITAAKLDVASVKAGIVTADAIAAVNITAVNITGGSITAVTITGGTITGATVRTASSGQRMEMNTFNLGGTLYPAVHMYTAANILAGYLYFNPTDNGIILKNEITQTSLVLDSTLGVKLIGNVGYTGSLKPISNWASGTSADGVWINDGTTAARRWKLYMQDGKLYARYGSGGSEYAIIGP